MKNGWLAVNKRENDDRQLGSVLITDRPNHYPPGSSVYQLSQGCLPMGLYTSASHLTIVRSTAGDINTRLSLAP